MAASRGSPLMREQRRDEEDPRERRSHRRDDASGQRRRSPASPKRRGGPDAGLKIKGRAVAEPAAEESERASHRPRGGDSEVGRHRVKDRSWSPRLRIRDEDSRAAGGVRSRRDDDRGRRYGEGDLFAHKIRKRSRSRSRTRVSYHHKDEAKRHRSPLRSGAEGARGRRPDRSYSPAKPSDRAPRHEHVSTREDRHAPYSSTARRRSRSPLHHRHADFEPRRRRSPYQEHRRPRSPSPRPRKRHRSPEPHHRSDRDPKRPAESPHTQHHSPPPYRTRHRSNSARGQAPRRKRSRSYDRESPHKDSKHRKKMQPGMHHGSHQTSPNRPALGFDQAGHHNNMNEAFPLHGMRANDVHGGMPRQNRPPHLDTRQQFSTSPQWTPTASRQGSPHSASPYSQGRGWPAQQPQYHGHQGAYAYSPPYRQNSYPPQQSSPPPHYQNAQQSPYGPGPPSHSGYPTQPHRGGHSGGYRGNSHSQGMDRRYSGSGQGPAPSPSPTGYGFPPASRGRPGHFQNLQWTANNANRNRDQPSSANSRTSPDPQFRPQIEEEEEDNPFRPSKDLQVQDEEEKERKVKEEAARKEAEASKESAKISFAFKSKPTAPAPSKLPPPDLLQKTKDIPKRNNLFDSSKSTSSQKASETSEVRRERDDRRPYRSDYRDKQRPDRDDRRGGRDPNRERGRERTPEPRTEKRIMLRPKSPRKLPPEMAASVSVYYRKPGNESVVGSGTYGKVFKAIHVYTKQLAALKKIRMDGEKDGFPVTAIREIKLLQSLRHENVVSLREVMVECNECFMVFEYLAHDLTGLLNHPTFKLEHAHRKDLSQQLFTGLHYLHRKGVLHRDIKAANILVSNEGKLKLADFGLARFYSKRGKLDYTNRVITIWYRSPELLLGETQYGPAVDIWSAACVMIEIFTRHAIFPGDGGEINQLDKIYNILGTPSRTDWPGIVDMAWFELLRPSERKHSTFVEKYKDKIPPAAFELLQSMFQYDPNRRPSAGDVLEHPYFTTEEPAPRQAVELKELEGDWHEFESKALRKENERKHQEAKRAARHEEHEREKAEREQAKRRTSAAASDREPKRPRPSSSSHGGETDSK